MKNVFIGYLQSKNKELTELLKDEKARTKLLASGYEDLESKNKELSNRIIGFIKDTNEVDHADWCMCRFCVPDFYKLKTNKS